MSGRDAMASCLRLVPRPTATHGVFPACRTLLETALAFPALGPTRHAGWPRAAHANAATVQDLLLYEILAENRRNGDATAVGRHCSVCCRREALAEM
jgi:hypothetical protein